MERRTIGAEIRASGDGAEQTLAGYAAVFHVRSERMWGDTYEVVAPGAFVASLAERDVIALWNHNTDRVMGSTRSGSLTLAEDDHGLAFELKSAFEGFTGEIAAVRAGDVQGMSFGFETVRDSYDYSEENGGVVIRTLQEVRLHEISPTPFPAYPQTDAQVRAAHRAAQALGRPEVFTRACDEAHLTAAEVRAMNLDAIGRPPQEPVGISLVTVRSRIVEAIS